METIHVASGTRTRDGWEPSMDAVRCLSCGATRWALFSGSFERLLAEPCQACGGETVVERRRPGGAQRKPPIERRDLRKPSELAGTGAGSPSGGDRDLS
jgi:hypothetical protein